MFVYSRVKLILRNILVVFLLSSSLFSAGQVVYFDILKGDDKLGSIRTEKKQEGSKLTYEVVSKATFRVIFQYIRETDMTSIYESGVFSWADSKQILDGNIKEHQLTVKEGMWYKCTEPPETDFFWYKEKINFCTNRLYFEEPVGEKFVFAESYQKLCPIKLISKGIYKMTLPDGNINHYVYKNGELQEVRIFRTIVDLVFRRAN